MAVFSRTVSVPIRWFLAAQVFQVVGGGGSVMVTMLYSLTADAISEANRYSHMPFYIEPLRHPCSNPIQSEFVLSNGRRKLHWSFTGVLGSIAAIAGHLAVDSYPHLNRHIDTWREPRLFDNRDSSWDEGPRQFGGYGYAH